MLLCFEIGLVLEKTLVAAHAVAWPVYPAYGVALIALAALAWFAPERDQGRLVIIAACAVGLAIPLMFSGMAGGGLRRVFVSVAVFVSAVGLIAGGLLVGLRTLIVVGYGVFGISILILLWQTIGTLLSQSLFFLVAGVALLALAAGAHKLASWSRSRAEPSPGTPAR
jgi:uncharacterized membrane protein